MLEHNPQINSIEPGRLTGNDTDFDFLPSRYELLGLASSESRAMLAGGLAETSAATAPLNIGKVFPERRYHHRCPIYRSQGRLTWLEGWPARRPRDGLLQPGQHSAKQHVGGNRRTHPQHRLRICGGCFRFGQRPIPPLQYRKCNHAIRCG